MSSSTLINLSSIMYVSYNTINESCADAKGYLTNLRNENDSVSKSPHILFIVHNVQRKCSTVYYRGILLNDFS